MKKSNAKEKLKEYLSSILFEKKLPTSKTKSKSKKEKEEPEEDIDTNDEGGNEIQVNPLIGQIQKALNIALTGAQKLGDQKLVKQIGNTITFFTRTQLIQNDGGGTDLMEGEGIEDFSDMDPKKDDQEWKDKASSCKYMLKQYEESGDAENGPDFSVDIIDFSNDKEELKQIAFDQHKYNDIEEKGGPELTDDGLPMGFVIEDNPQYQKLNEDENPMRFKIGDKVKIIDLGIMGTVEQLPNYPTRPNYYINVEDEGLYSALDKELELYDSKGKNKTKSTYNDEDGYQPSDFDSELNEFLRLQELAGIKESDVKNNKVSQIEKFISKASKEDLKELVGYMDGSNLPQSNNLNYLIEIAEKWLNEASSKEIDSLYDILYNNGFLESLEEYGLEHDPENVEDEDFDHPTLEKRKKEKLKEEDEESEDEDIEDNDSEEKDIIYNYIQENDNTQELVELSQLMDIDVDFYSIDSKSLKDEMINALDEMSKDDILELYEELDKKGFINN